MTRPSTAAAGLLVVGVLVLASVPAYGASRTVVRDGAHDVWKVLQGFPEDDVEVDRPKADVLRMVARHRTHQVTVRMAFVDLRRVGWQRYDAKVRTPERTYVVNLISHRRLWAGTSGLYVGSRVQRCAGLDHEIDYADEVVVMRIPRSCISRPRWVRVQGINYHWPDVRFDEQLLTDNPHTHTSGAKRMFTDRLRRG